MRKKDITDSNNPNFRYKITKQFLIKEYIKNKKPIIKIAQELECSITPIRRNLKKYNIKIRSVGEGLSIAKKGNKLSEKNKRNISKSLKETYRTHPELRLKLSRKGKENPNWRGGLSELPYVMFTDTLKEEIRARDNYVCQLTGITQEEHIAIHGTSLNVHHIDYDKINNSKDNLITLSKESHSRTNFNRKYWIKYFQDLIRSKNALFFHMRLPSRTCEHNQIL